MKKKILIIDDDADNLAGAKDFFSTIPGFDFIYTKSVYEGLEQLPNCDALISDKKCGSVNYTIEQYPMDELKQSVIYSMSDMAGYYLLLKAKSLNKPAIMISEHGKVNMFVIKNVGLDPQILKLLEKFESKLGADLMECLLFLGYCHYGFENIISNHKYTSKQKRLIDASEGITSSAWALAWTILSKKL